MNEDAPLIASIDDAAEGAWLVATETGSTYVVDLDARTVQRTGTADSLRRDGEQLKLHQVASCRVGTSAEFLIEVTPGIFTLRTTSHVLSIRPST